MDEFVGTWISSSPRVCRNATMSTDADAVLALAVGDPEILLADVRELGETETLQYARSWLTLVADNETQLKRWWFDLCGSTHELCYFETDQCQALNLPAQACIDLSEARLIDALDARKLGPMIEERRPSDGGELTEFVRLMCDVRRTDDAMPLGLDLSQDFVISRFGPGSPAEVSSGQGGLQIGDRLLAVDGHDVDVQTAGKNKKKGKAVVKELLRDLDAYPKQVHTFTVERRVPVASGLDPAAFPRFASSRTGAGGATLRTNDCGARRPRSRVVTRDGGGIQSAAAAACNRRCTVASAQAFTGRRDASAALY